jgi:hypothetical protein
VWLGTFVVVVAAGVTWGVTLALAQPTTFIDLTTSGATHTVDGAIYTEGTGPAGTGQFDPFLTLSTNADTEKGYNTTQASGEFDSFFGGGRTHPLLASAIPPETVNGVVYREFSLDANDSGSDDYMSIDQIKLFNDSQNNLTGYTDNPAVGGGGTFSNDSGTTAHLMYNMDGSDDEVVLMRSQALSPGSGVSDITVLVPDSDFPAGCDYGSTTCNQYVYFYSAMGGLGTSTQGNGCSAGCNYNVTAGFEEWRTRLLPVVDVTKTVNASINTTFDWTVKKYVSDDDTCQTGFIDAQTAAAADALNIDLFNGQSDTVCWKIVSTRGDPQTSNGTISGNITISNPTGGTVISTSIDAVLNSVDDIVTQGGTSHPTITCPFSFPHTIKAGTSVVCPYTESTSSTAAGSNTAKAFLDNGTAPDLEYDSDAVPFTVGNTTTDATASLTDSRGLPGKPITLSGSDTRTYTQDLSCSDAPTVTNTATLTETDSQTQHTDPANVNIACHTLSVSKTATPAFDRTFDWTVKKYVSDDDSCQTGFLDAQTAAPADALNIDLFKGQTDTVCWKIVSTRGDAQDSGWRVSGTITVTNNAPIAATGVSVTDVITPGNIAADHVDCDAGTAGDQNTNLTIAANGGSIQCSYSFLSGTLPDGTTRTNTATATLAGHDYTGTHSVDFSGVTPTTTDATASLTDSRGLPNKPISLSGTDTRTYTEDLSCGVSRTETNTATLTETDSQTQHTDPANVNINCHTLDVSKTATPAFDRTYDWTVKKYVAPGTCDSPGTFVDDTLGIDLFNGQTADVCWKIVSTRGAAQDSGWRVSGTITVTNNAPIAATGVSVGDVITPGSIVADHVDCDAGTAGDQNTNLTVPANSSIQCSYSFVSGTLPDGTTRTNTATATLAGQDYTGQHSVDFGGVTPTTTDATASLGDDRHGQFTGLSGNRTDTYGETLDCSDAPKVVNTATLTETDSGTQHTDPAEVDINCNGLTVTKTANPAFDRTYDWTVKKYVAPGTCDSPGTFVDDTLGIDLFNGQTADVCWKIVSTRGDAQDSGWRVSGTITVTNNAPIAATGVNVTDLITPGDIAADHVDCDAGTAGDQNTNLTITANGGSIQCSYSFLSGTLPDGTTRTNTATATLAGQDYTGQHSVDFSGVTPTTTDATASLGDDRHGQFTGLNGNRTDTYGETLDCSDAPKVVNTATLTETDSGTQHTDPAEVDINCNGLTVTKTATPAFDRTYDWTVKKYVSDDDTCQAGFVDDTLNITIDVGQSDTVCWKIVSTRGDAQDSGWRVSGTITVTNNAPIAATGVNVSDMITGSIAADHVDCDSGTAGDQNSNLTIAANGGSIQCSYSFVSGTLPDGTTRTNTATATLAGHDYTGTAGVDFSGVTPDTTDATASLGDDRHGVFPGLSGNRTDTYTESLPCGSSRTVDNLATLTETDSGTQHTDPAHVAITCVVPFQGCTPGFWKNHLSQWNTAAHPVASLLLPYLVPPFGYDSGVSNFNNQSFWTIFGIPSGDHHGLPSNLTLKGALNKGGGGYSALARHGTAALLSSVWVDYEYDPTDVLDGVRAAFMGTDPNQVILPTFPDGVLNDLTAANSLDESACVTGNPG